MKEQEGGTEANFRRKRNRSVHVYSACNTNYFNNFDIQLIYNYLHFIYIYALAIYNINSCKILFMPGSLK